MVDSQDVLNGQTIAYTLYVIVILLLMSWFALRVTKGGKSKVKPALFYTFVTFITLLGVSLHIITFNTIPWAEVDLNRSDYTPDVTFEITVENHENQDMAIEIQNISMLIKYGCCMNFNYPLKR